MNIPKNNVIICPPTKRSIRKISKIIGDNNFKWVYLGEDVANAIAVEKSIGQKGERIDISDTLQQIAHSFRQPYIDYIGNLSVKHNSMLWWAGSLSEKNHFISKTFLHSCYVKVVLSLLELHMQDNLIFLVESRALRSSIVTNISEIFRYDVVRIETKFSDFLESLTSRMEFIIKQGWFVINHIYRIALTQHIYRLNKIDFLYGKGNSDNDLTLIHTWVDHRSFTQNNDFQDAYFGTLGRYMAENGKNVVFVPYILYTVPYAKTIKKLMNCKEHFLIPAAHLRISDVVDVLKRTMKKPEKKGYPHFENICISDLIHQNQINDWKDARLTSNLLLYYVVKNLKTLNLSIDRFIYPHENQTWEKLYCIAFREFFPEANLVGYQHSTVSKMYLFYSISQNERKIIPFPDIVITNGKYFKQILLESGYDPIKLINGGAIRYEYITDIINRPTPSIKKNENGGKEFKILVAASIDKNESVELLKTVLNAFESLDVCEVILKLHPMMPYQRIVNETCLTTSLPEHFVISTQPISILLNKCDVLVYKTTTICVEALATGVYPIHVKSNYIIDCDILDGIPEEIHSSVKTEEELLCKVKELLEMDPEELYKRKMMAKNIAKSFFGTVDNSVFDLFIKNV